MKIGYNKMVGIAFMLFSLFSCCVAAVFVRSDVSMPAALGAGFWLSLLVGILLLTSTYIEITQSHVIVKSTFGFVTKRYAFNSAKDFTLESGKIYVLSDGLRQRLAVSWWMADKRGWTSFVKWIKDEGMTSAVTPEAEV